PGRTEHEAVLRGIPPGAPGRWRDVRVRAVPGPDGRGRTDRAGRVHEEDETGPSRATVPGQGVGPESPGSAFRLRRRDGDGLHDGIPHGTPSNRAMSRMRTPPHFPHRFATRHLYRRLQESTAR